MNVLPASGLLPYRGLDFFRENEAPLFVEREKEIDECAQLLTGFGIKILLLQGTSGSGKSSFLRAGLVPRLKVVGSEKGTNLRNPCFFWRTPTL